jgi:hypothetical protein
VPISRELARVIKEQQAYVLARFPEQAPQYLFLTCRDQVYKRSTLGGIINSVAHKHDLAVRTGSVSGSSRTVYEHECTRCSCASRDSRRGIGSGRWRRGGSRWAVLA